MRGFRAGGAVSDARVVSVLGAVEEVVVLRVRVVLLM